MDVENNNVSSPSLINFVVMTVAEVYINNSKSCNETIQNGTTNAFSSQPSHNNRNNFVKDTNRSNGRRHVSPAASTASAHDSALGGSPLSLSSASPSPSASSQQKSFESQINDHNSTINNEYNANRSSQLTPKITGNTPGNCQSSALQFSFARFSRSVRVAEENLNENNLNDKNEIVDFDVSEIEVQMEDLLHQLCEVCAFYFQY